MLKQPIFKTWTSLRFAGLPVFEIIFRTDNSRLAIEDYNKYVQKMRNFDVMLVKNLPIPTNKMDGIKRVEEGRKALIMDISDLQYSKDTGMWLYKITFYFDEGESTAFDMYGSALNVLDGRDYKYTKKEK